MIGTSIPNLVLSDFATGASENASSYLPASGRPKCDTRITLAT